MNNISNNNNDSNDNSARAEDNSFKMEAQAQNFNTFCDLCDPQIESDNGDSLQATEVEITPLGDATTTTTTPSGAPTKATQSMPDFRCICDWDKCQYVSQQFFLLANDGHPWKGPSLSWTKSTSKKIVILVKNQLFRAGVLQSLKIPEEEHTRISKRFRIARHHFPLSLWVEIGVTARLMSTLLTTDNVKQIDKLRSSNRSGEYRNSVQFLRTQTDQKFNDNDISALDGIYVCVPIQEQASTLVETKRLLDERTHVTTLANDNDTDYSTPNKSEEDRKPNVLRISTDKKVEHESDKKKQKIAHVPLTLDDPFPTPEIQREYLAQCYLQHYDADNLEPFAKSVRRTLNYVASEYHFDPDQQITIFELAPKAFLHTCLSTARLDGCELFTIQQRVTGRQLCLFCYELSRRCERREKKIEITAVSRVQASSTVNFSSMSPPALRNRMRYMSGKIRSQNVTIRKYKLTLKEVREDECITFDKDQIPAVLEQVFDYMGSEEQNVQLETKILNVLLKSKLLKDEYDIQADHLKEYATIGRMMGDECKKISGKKKSIKFDSRMMRTALVTFLEDGRKGLNKLRERSIKCVPSLRTVQREYAHIRVGESWHCPLYCAMFYDVLADIGALEDRTTPVQLMFDEIKLKCGIWFNCTTNEIYGLTPTKNATSLNFAEEIEAMAEECITEDNESPNVGPIDNLDDVCVNLDDEETSYVGAASKANVFRARTGKNQSWNIAYFLNCGSLDGDTIVKQILHVITCCEMAGLSVQGFVSDAGPNNVRAFTLITRGKCLKLCKGLLKKDSVSFRNPLTPEELIFMILCLVHGLKNMRNQFFIGRAPPEGKRKLVNNGNQIKWENIIDLYDLVESNQLESRCVRELPKLTFQAVDLDKWSKMNVHYAKVIFTDDTINYQLNVLRQKLGLNSNFFDNIIQEYCVKIGFEAELLLDKISLLMEVVFADGSQVAKELKDMMAQIEFSGYVHFIFIARFLNKRAHLTLGREVREFRMTDGKIHLSLNIKSERKAMEKCIAYFDKWKAWMKGENPLTWEVHKQSQMMVSHQTYRNLKVAITGFFEYAENVLSKKTSVVFVPFLHSNQNLKLSSLL